MELTHIAEEASSQVKTLILESEDDLIAAIKDVAAEAQLHGKEKYQFKMTHTIVLDLSGGAQKHSLTWNVSKRTDSEPVQLQLATKPAEEAEQSDQESEQQ